MFNLKQGSHCHGSDPGTPWLSIARMPARSRKVYKKIQMRSQNPVVLPVLPQDRKQVRSI